MADKFEEIVPWLTNGTLNAEDRAWAEAELERSESARSSLEWETMLRSAIQEQAATYVPPDRALDQVLHRIRQSRPAARKHSRLGEFFIPLFASLQRAPGFAVAFAIMVVQFAVIGHLLSSRQTDDDYRGIQAHHQSAQFIRLMFKPDATERALRELLQGMDADIVAGPTQLGDYYLWVAPKRTGSALTALQADPRIESAEIVNALPEQP